MVQPYAIMLQGVTMLAHEWHELETLCQRINNLRLRYAAAQRTNNGGMLDGLKQDIANAGRQRELLLHYMAARLGSVTAEREHRAASDASGAIMDLHDEERSSAGEGRSDRAAAAAANRNARRS